MSAPVVSVAPPPPSSAPTASASTGEVVTQPPSSAPPSSAPPSSAPPFYPPPHQHGRTPSLPLSLSPPRPPAPRRPGTRTTPAPSGNHPHRDRPRRSSSFVMVEASYASGGDSGVARTKCLTENDLEELKGCLDLGFGFAYSEMPVLCGTLPALELCYSMTRRFLDEQRAPGQEREEQHRSQIGGSLDQVSIEELVTSSIHCCSSGRGILSLGSLQMTSDSGSDRNILWACLLLSANPSNHSCSSLLLKGVA